VLVRVLLPGGGGWSGDGDGSGNVLGWSMKAVR